MDWVEATQAYRKSDGGLRMATFVTAELLI
jgi:hypothetical protein